MDIEDATTIFFSRFRTDGVCVTASSTVAPPTAFTSMYRRASYMLCPTPTSAASWNR